MENKGMVTDRYTHLRNTMGEDLFGKVQKAKVLVVGAGGIGCELLKNLVLSGFQDIEVVDLDTIDQSNLNRQFLFRPHHVNQSKALMAREAVLKFNPMANVVAHHGNVKESRFGLLFIKKFDMVLNALDNVAARRHVNRLCLAESKPLIESGTTGYLGQVHVISKGETECYDCKEKHTPKQHPICTIRSTPSKPVHCIVWAKELFCLMFGKAEESMLFEETEGGGDTVTDRSTYMDQILSRPKEGADAEALHTYSASVLKCLFSLEIIKQLGMGRYKGAEKPPTPIDERTLEAEAWQSDEAPGSVRERGWDRKEWSLEESIREFSACVHQVYRDSNLKSRVMQAATAGISNGRTGGGEGGDDSTGAGAGLVFDKDDQLSMRFVTASTNLRSRVFKIPVQSYYEAKGVAGNIIPAIATTNAIIAGLQVMEALKILKGDVPIVQSCKYTYCLREPTRKGLFLQPTALAPPSRSCFVCSAQTLELRLNTEEMTLVSLIDKVLKRGLGINEPMVMVECSILYEDGDDDSPLLTKILKDLPGGGIVNGTSVNVEDLSQDLSVNISVIHEILDEEKVPEGYLISGKPTVKSTGDADADAAVSTSAVKEVTSASASNGDGSAVDEDDVEVLDDDIVTVERGEMRDKIVGEVKQATSKRPADNGGGKVGNDIISSKKPKLNAA